MTGFLAKLKPYPIKVIIYEERAGNIVPVMDSAIRFKEKTGEQYYHLKKKNVKLPVQKFQNIYSGHKTNILHLYSSGADDFQPMIVKKSKERDAKLVSEEESVKYWQVISQKDSIKRWTKQSALMTYLPIISLVIFAVAVVLVFNSFSGSLEQMGQVANSIGNTQKEIATMQLEMIHQLKTIGIETTKVINQPPAITPP